MAVAAGGGRFTLDDFTVTDPTTTSRVGDLPERGHPPDHPSPEGDLRRGLSRLPVARPLHHLGSGQEAVAAPAPALQRAHRARAQDPDFQAVYRQHRPMVERSIAWLVSGPNRRCVRGTLWLHHRVAGLNLRRLLNLGLTRTAGTWATA